MSKKQDKLEISDSESLIGVQKRGQKRVREIVKVAEEIFAFEGYERFSLRYIASKAGTSLGSVQHYFPNKDSLLKTVIEQRLKDNIDKAQEVINEKNLDSVQRFKRFIDYCVECNSSPFIRAFHYELWSIASRDKFFSDCRDSMTDAYCEFIYELITPLATTLSKKERKKKAVLILAALQGLRLSSGPNTNTSFDSGDLNTKLKTELLNFAQTKLS